MVTLLSSLSSLSIGNAQDVSSVGTANSASGATTINVNELVTLKVQPYVDRADFLAAQINARSLKIAAYQTMQEKLTALTTAMGNLTKLAGSTSAFDTRTATLVGTAYNGSSSVSSPDALVNVTVSDGADMGSHWIVVEQVAEAESRKSDTVDKTSWTSSGGTFSINGQSITVSAGASISDVVSAINGAGAGVTASLVNVGNGEVRMVLTANDTGVDNAITYDSETSGVLAELGIFDSDNLIQSAQNAILTVDGVSGIEYSSNEVTDAIGGVTLNLVAADAGTKISLTIEQNVETLATAIGDFVDAYNEWRSFYDEMTALEGSAAASTAYLFGDSTLRAVNNELSSIIASMAKGSADGSVNLASIGITINSSNQLSVDSTKLLNALQNNYATIQTLFMGGTTVSDLGSGVSISVSSTSSFSGTLTIEYDPTDTQAGGYRIYDNGTEITSYFKYNSGHLSIDTSNTEAATSIYLGLSITVSNAGGTTGTIGTIDVNLGIARDLYDVSKKYGGVSGIVQDLVTTLEDKNTNEMTRYNNLVDRAQSYTDYLVLQYGTMAAKVAAANQTLLTLQALIDAENN